MSADRLRKVAAEMREFAEAATPVDKWVRGRDAGDPSSLHINYRPYTYAVVYAGTAANRDHIAAWSPPVALAVADWLSQIAGMYPSGHTVSNAHAVKIADAWEAGRP